MPSIKSDLTDKNLPISKFREIEIPDESAPVTFDTKNISAFNARQLASRQLDDAELEALERRVEDAKRAKTGNERLSLGARQRIEMLCGISRSTKEVNIDGNIFLLKTLKGKEQRAAIAAASEYDNTVESPFEIRKQLLARAVGEVAGTDIELFLNNTSLESKLDFIEELDEAVLNKLYNEYLSLINDAQSKYSIKTSEDVKEVIEDLKK